MKKLFLSLFTITSFVMYGVYQRGDVSKNNTHVAPTTIALQVNPTASIPRFSDDENDSETRRRKVPLSPPTTSPVPTNSVPNPTTQQTTGQYKDGSYTGSVADAFYGNIQVKAIIQGGKIADVQFLQYPNDRGESISINTAAMPILKQEAIRAQNSAVDIVSGATDSSAAFIQSLGSALAQARI